jgi:hypothetical protein
VLQIVEEAASKVTTTDRIEAAFAALTAQKKDDDPTTH